MDPTRATSPAGSQGSNDTQPDLPHSMLFVPKFTKARELRPLDRDGTPVNPELNREPSPADVPPLPLPRASRAREGSPRARPSTSLPLPSPLRSRTQTQHRARLQRNALPFLTADGCRPTAILRARNRAGARVASAARVHA